MCKEGTAIGFAGIDKQDIILYLARILYHAGKRVLIVDQSETQAVTECIPCPDGLDQTIIEYRGIYFLRAQKREEDWSSILGKKGYDFILTDYGFHPDARAFSVSDHIICVTDQQKHNWNRVLPLLGMGGDKLSMIIRDVVGHIAKEWNRNGFPELALLPADRIHVMYLDELDMKCKIRCQYEISYHFKRLSIPTQNVIKKLVMEMLPGINRKELRSAYRKAQRGD